VKSFYANIHNDYTKIGSHILCILKYKI